MSLRQRGQVLLSWLGKRGYNPWVASAYVGTLVLFLFVLGQFYIPGKGFSYLIAFGGTQEQSRLTKVRKLDYYVQRSTSGYDAQFYVQIAMDPSLQNSQLKKAVDNLPYRARRIFFSATAYLFGLGDPAKILQVYALQNAFCWFLLAGVLLHWFPPKNWDFFLRWFGVLCSLGLCLSFRSALIDGPSLLMIALGLYFAERNKVWLSAAVLALSGLAKETNLLAAASFLPGFSEGRKRWVLAVLKGLVVAAPLILWVCYLHLKLGPAVDVGSRNFDWPFFGYIKKWQQVLIDFPDMGWPTVGPIWSLLLLISLTFQMGYFLLKPQWEKAWWRIGSSFAVLMIVLGDAVWEGYPGAASRVLLPMQLAFNILVPVGRWWRIILLAGNLTLLASPFELQPPTSEGYVMGGDSALFTTKNGKAFRLEYTDGWYGPEGNRGFFWCWARGDAGYKIQNPHPFAVRSRLKFSMFSAGRRSVSLKVNGEDFWGTMLGEYQLVDVTLSSLILQPGENLLEWKTNAPPIMVDSDPRELAFVVQNLHLDVLHEIPKETKP